MLRGRLQQVAQHVLILPGARLDMRVHGVDEMEFLVTLPQLFRHLVEIVIGQGLADDAGADIVKRLRHAVELQGRG